MWNRLRTIVGRVRIFLKSIRFRLTLWSAGVLAVILVLFCLFVYSRQSYDLEAATRTELEVKAQQIGLLYRTTGVFDPSGNGLSISSAELIQRESGLLQANDTLALVSLDGQTLQQSGPLDTAGINQLVQSWQNANQGSHPEPGMATGMLSINKGPKTRYLFLISPVSVERRIVGLMILGQPIDPDKQLSRLAFTLLFGSLATLAFVLVGGYWLAAKAMSPVRKITYTARQIGETDLHQRLKLGTQDELGELADTFDAMLDRLQAAFDRQRQFTADASHELRTPLTIVGLETDYALARRRTSDEYERSMRVIQSENQFMAHLVGDLLTLARMDSGQAQLRLEPLDLSDVALDVVERLGPLAQRDQIDLSTGDLPEVCITGDRQQLSQMLTNLVENGLKYAGGAGKRVHVETGTADEEGEPYGWVRVSDNGQGIPAEHLPHLFERFYRVDSSRTRAAEADPEKIPDGSGLGLSIVQWIAQAHKGQVSVQSEVGKGTTFEVRLPLDGKTSNA